MSYTCDKGNLTHDGIFAYTYDAAGRLIGAESITHTIVYTYNGDGVRVAQSVDGQGTEWVQDMTGLAQVLVETSGGSTKLTSLYHQVASLSLSPSARIWTEMVSVNPESGLWIAMVQALIG